jgi:hypothetical protein
VHLRVELVNEESELGRTAVEVEVCVAASREGLENLANVEEVLVARTAVSARAWMCSNLHEEEDGSSVDAAGEK